MKVGHILSCLLFLLLFSYSSGHSQKPQVAELTKNEIAEDQRYLDKVAADQRSQKLEYEKSILEAKERLHDENQSRLETIIALFGVSIAFSAIVFGIATWQGAIAAASKGIEKEREAINKITNDVMQRKEDVERLSELITLYHDEMMYQSSVVLERVLRSSLNYDAGRFSAEIPISDRSSVFSMKKSVSEISITEMLPMHYKILLASAAIEGKWVLLREIAEEFKGIFVGDHVVGSCADFVVALSMAQCGNIEDARRCCIESMGAYTIAGSPDVARNVARLSYFRALLERQLSETRIPSQDEVAVLKDIVRTFENITGDEEIDEIRDRSSIRLEIINNANIRDNILPSPQQL